ncbi:sigma-70 family RNA polymerase sigma factor [Neisseriaceae bacterium JH1-16]|nr:sigma-70 family RNA polymerase sigma factor [Neisseriaceae bacterium JH1-16]
MSRFEQLVMPHLKVAWHLARWLARNDHDAEDVVQEAFLRAFRYFDGFHGGNARAWLLTIVRNAYYDSLPSGLPTEPLDEDDHGMALADWSANPEQLAQRSDDCLQVNTALRRLPPVYREVLVLREIAECSYRDIADISGVPVGTVMSRLSRARAMLLHYLAESEEK